MPHIRVNVARCYSRCCFLIALPPMLVLKAGKSSHVAISIYSVIWFSHPTRNHRKIAWFKNELRRRGDSGLNKSGMTRRSATTLMRGRCRRFSPGSTNHYSVCRRAVKRSWSNALIRARSSKATLCFWLYSCARQRFRPNIPLSLQYETSPFTAHFSFD